MHSDDLTAWSAREIARAVRSRAVSPVEVLDAHLMRIGADRTNAVVTIDEHARDAALQAERAVMQGDDLGALHGVPFTVKDVLDTAGLRTTAGSRIFHDHVPARDAGAVARFRAAGAILVGKTSCPEFALEPQTANPVFGTTRNPHDLRLGPGGSSGGCAAAVAGRLTPLSLGSDYGGSVRFPAHCTGVFGLRPTPGRVPADGQRPAPPSGTPRAQFSLVGPLARTAGDVALALSVLASSPELDSATERDRTLRCTWATGEGTVVVRADVVAVLEHAARALAETGHVVAEGLPPGFERAQPLFGELRVTDDYADLAELVQGREADLTPRIRGLLDDAPPAPDPATRDALLAELRDLRARVDALLEETPVLLLPVAVVPAFPTGSTTLDVDGRIHVVDAMTILAPCRAVSVLGLPAASVPAGVSRDGTPVGVQVVGRAGREDDVLAVAAELEAALGGWQPPPVPPHAHSDSRTVQGPAPGSSIR